MKPAFIFDIDGTLATKHPDREIYEYDKVGNDFEIANVAELYRILHTSLPDYTFLLVTGREDTCRDVTAAWLAAHGLPHHALHMRAEGDRREDTVVKQEIYEAEIQPFYDVKGVFEDRQRVARMWHSLGLTVFRVGDPDSDF